MALDRKGSSIEKSTSFNDLARSDTEAGEGIAIDGMLALAREGTKRGIKSRHAQMIAIGGTIGTGLFVGAGQALSTGGPAFLLAAYIIISLLVYGVVTGAIEIASYLPVSGASMAYFTTRFTSPSLGFALGWLYFYSFGIILAYEITAGSIVINYWQNDVHQAVWITILLVVIVGLNFAPVNIYAETEFWFAGIKVIMLLGLLLVSLIIMLGGGPEGQRLGFHYWNDPGAVNAYILPGSSGRFTSFLYVLVFSGFSFYFGPELVIFTTGEMKNPRKNLPIAARHFFYRLMFFYVLGALAIGVICSSNATDLTTGAGNANASPWVIGIRNAGINVLPSIVNAGILISAWSSGNSYLYMSSRSLYSLAIAGSAPRIFARCNHYGLPVYAMIASSLFSLLAYLSVGSQAGVVFNWFISLTNTAGFTSWIVCCITLLRFRKACNAQAVTPPYRSWTQPWASWICIVIFTILLLANGFTVFYPGQWETSSFIVTYLGIPIFLILFLGHKLLAARSTPWLTSPMEVDLTSNMQEIEALTEMWTDADHTSKETSGSKRAWWKKISIIWE